MLLYSHSKDTLGMYVNIATRGGGGCYIHTTEGIVCVSEEIERESCSCHD